MTEDTFDKYIMEIKDACSDEICDEIIKLFESDDCKKNVGTTGMLGVCRSLKQTTDAHFDANIPHQRKLREGIACILGEAKFKYIEMCKDKNLDRERSVPTIDNTPRGIIEYFLINCVETLPQIQKYVKGDFFNWHSDYCTFDQRFLAYILYLNDVDSGGETVFISGKRVKPEKGKLLIFPTNVNYLHKGEELKKGTKYIITSFSLVPHDYGSPEFKKCVFKV